MGIDIYLNGYGAYNRRTTKERKQVDLAVKRRDKCLDGSKAEASAQAEVDACYHAMQAGAKGYLRSSYNVSGLFNVLDRIFGTDSAALLFPGNWDADLTIDWQKFQADVAQMRKAASCLKHGDPLPIKFDELHAEPSRSRAGGEAFGKAVVGMTGTLTEAQGEGLMLDVGNEHAAGFYNLDDYEWYVTEGLQDLEDFGKLGAKLAKAGRPAKVHISF